MSRKQLVSKKSKKAISNKIPATVQTSGTNSPDPRGIGAGRFPQGAGGGFSTRSFQMPGIGIPGLPFPGGGGGGFPPSFPGGGGGFPPSFPGGGGGGFPPGTPQGGPGATGGPQTPPPSFIPQQSGVSALAVDPGSIRRCINRFVYIWQRNGDAYWMFLTHVGRNSIAGYRWYGFGPTGFWLYFGLDIQRIGQFNCF
ncbi:hypothetical protein [Paenibacillus periandrae]|uniref:hypothetical protein n=1 Tax=Paenibacillus periandrae TaxID=1761741 RepID=UPI0030845A61